MRTGLVRSRKVHVSRVLGLFSVPLIAALSASCDSLPSEVSSQTELDSDDEVTFTDSALEQRVRQVLGAGDGPLTVAHLEGLTALNRVGGGITDLSGLEHAVNLEQLYLPNNDVRDLRALSALSALKRLNLSHNDVSDLAPLAGLTGLEHLDLDGNALADLSPLSGMTSLATLELEGTGITDLDALSGLTGLEVLYLGENQISDVSPLVGLDALRILDLSGNAIDDLAPLGASVALAALLLDGNAITDLSPLVGNTGLSVSPSHVSLRGNPLSEAALCSDVPALQDDGVVVRGAGTCPSDGPADASPAITTDRDLYLSQRHYIEPLFTNRGDATLHGNKCTATGRAWEWQLRLERQTEDEWVLAFDPVALLCLGPRTIEPDGNVSFSPFPVGAETGIYRLIWARVYTDADHQETPPLDQRVSAPFSIVAP